MKSPRMNKILQRVLRLGGVVLGMGGVLGVGCIMGLCMTAPALAQENIPSKVDIQWNRYHTYEEFVDQLKELQRAYPDLVTLKTIGKTLQGRPMIVAIVNDPSTGPDTSKPAMWIDGNVHGNEIQAGEAVMYSIWYLAKAHGVNEQLTELLKNYSFYFLPSQNPDGRDYWFSHANTPHSSRTNQRPVDNDRDGLFDEDPPDDLDGDGNITSMWIKDPQGRWIRDRNDPRIFKRVAADEKGEWTNLGSEGIDNDGDGRKNEDGPGGDDMNRNWPSDWKPPFVQFLAGPYPLSHPETRAIAQFIMGHPNIAASQSYHNSGGMILRGPGAKYAESRYPGDDRRVYDEIARTGEQILPYYRSMVIYKDLYTVHGGFVNWMAEGLGVISFTNELWSPSKFFQRDVARPDSDQQWIWRDRIAFGQTFTDYTEYDHPRYGKVLIGGPNKWSSRNTPTFMLEEECHRNFAFTMYHADQMPLISFGKSQVQRLADGLWSVTIEVRNEKLIPSRTGLQRQKSIGTTDLLTVEGASVVAAGTLGSWRDLQMKAIKHEPQRVQVKAGIPGRGMKIFRFIIRARAGSEVQLRYDAERAQNITTTVKLVE